MKLYNTKKAFLWGIPVAIIFFSLFPSSSQASDTLRCPPGFQCEFMADVLLGKAKCPDGYKCTPLPALPGCPSEDICYIKTKNASSTTSSSIVSGNNIYSYPPSSSSVVSLPPSTSAASAAPVVSSISPTSGQLGSSVFILGQNFDASTQIDLVDATGNTTIAYPNNIQSNISTYITFNIPANLTSGAYVIYIKNSSGLLSSPVSYTVLSSGQSNAIYTSSTTTNPTNVPSATYTNPPVTQTVVPTYVQTQTYTPSNTFQSGSQVVTNSNLKVRTTPSVSGALLGVQPQGALGMIKTGGVTADGYTWWNIDYAVGADGWSAGSFLNLAPMQNISSGCFTFSNNLSFGSGSGNFSNLSNDVGYLQAVLALQGFPVSSTEKSAHSFGDSTLASVINFQEKYGITPNAGFVGVKTRAELNLLYGCK